MNVELGYIIRVQVLLHCVQVENFEQIFTSKKHDDELVSCMVQPLSQTHLHYAIETCTFCISSCVLNNLHFVQLKYFIKEGIGCKMDIFGPNIYLLNVAFHHAI